MGPTSEWKDRKLEQWSSRSVVYAALRLKRDQVALVPVVVVRATSNVAPPVPRAPAMELGDR